MALQNKENYLKVQLVKLSALLYTIERINYRMPKLTIHQLSYLNYKDKRPAPRRTNFQITIMNTKAQPTPSPALSSTTLPVRTLAEFQRRVNCMTREHQLTEAGKDLVKAYEWKFIGDDYRRAWGYLFVRARQLGLTYCKQFKRFYKSLPPKPAIGDRVKLTSIGATGIVTGYSRFDIMVSIDNENREVEVSVEYLEKL